MNRRTAALHFLGYGTLTWMIPFLTSLLFYRPGGTPIGGEPLMKSVMVVVGVGAGSVLLLRIFRTQPRPAYSGLLVGTAWLAWNIVLDLLVLLPMAKMPVADYVAGIAVRYLTIPIVAVVIDLASRGPRHPSGAG